MVSVPAAVAPYGQRAARSFLLDAKENDELIEVGQLHIKHRSDGGRAVEDTYNLPRLTDLRRPSPLWTMCCEAMGNH
jgi:hypothetical protein